MSKYRPSGPDGLVTGIVLTATPMFESDRRVELLTQTHGRVTLVAKGAMASVKRFGGRLEPTTVINVSCRVRSSMWVMTDASVVEAFLGIRTQYDAIACAMYMIELARKVTVDGQPHPGLFRWLHSAVIAIDQNPMAVRDIQGVYERQLLELEGVCPTPFFKAKFMSIFSEYTGQWINQPTYIGGRS